MATSAPTSPATPVPMPAPIAAYIAAKQVGDHEGAVAAFTPDAVVVDEHVEHVGTDAIGQWLREVTTAFRPTYEPLEAVAVGERTIVAVRVAGDFPGSPVTLYFHVALRDDHIAALTILA